MQVFQAIGILPSIGSTILATIGWIKNSRNALTNSVDVNGATTVEPARALERSSVSSKRSGLSGVKWVVFMKPGLMDFAPPQPGRT